MKTLTYIFRFILAAFAFSAVTFATDMSVVKFDTDEVGYIAGDNGFLSKTTDGGLTWNTITTNITENINDIAVMGDFTLFIACDGGKIMKTEDGGSTWEVKTSEITDNITSIVYTLDSRMIACGDNSLILLSLDYGNTWEAVYTTASSDLKKLFFYDAAQGYIVGTNGTLLTTNDGGISWTVKLTDYSNFNFTSISMTDDKTGTIIGENGLIFNTAHSWNKWRIVAPFTSETIGDISYTNDTDGIAVSGNSILRTTNAGTNWNYVNLQNRAGVESYTSLCFSTPTRGFIVGSNGSILYTTDGGTTWTPLGINQPGFDQISSSNNIEKLNSKNLNSPDNFKLSQNYPNPFNPSTMITYYLPADSHLKLKVFDMTGKEVAVLVNEFKAAGSHSVQFSANGLSSGVYLYSMIAESGSNKVAKTMKMILTK